MKITHNKVGQNLNVVDGTKSEKTGKSANANKADGTKIGLNKELSEKDSPGTDKMSTRVEMSPRAQEAKRIKELALAGPDVDEAKVEKFRRLIDEGKYKVDSKQVADRMVDEHMNTIGGD
ncbi:MAG: flagellar biosynthesis anti-sigma factor FlgM [Bdellovibrionaceae bacterium]|nr:flagellar biosynthesis anti-sigma factor FlgM [Pseudobdellovibrionaceae bacterium]